MAADLLAKIRSEIDERIAALRPLLDEYDRLSAAAEAFAAVKAGDFSSAEHPPEPPSAAPFLDSAEEDLSASTVEDEEDLLLPALDEEVSATASFVEETLAATSPEEPPSAPEPSGEGPSPPAPSGERSSAFSPSVGAPPDAPARRDVRRGGPWTAGAFGPAMSLRTTPPIQPIRLTPSRVQKDERPSEERGAFARRAAEAQRASFERRFAEADGAQSPPADEPLPAHESLPAHEPVSPSAVRRAILAALEHGSHTTTELVMVTAMRPADIRRSLGVLADRGEIAKVRRAGDNRAAFALRSVLARV